MMCEKGCKSTIEQRLSKIEGVVSCKVEYEAKTASLDFDDAITSPGDMISMVESIAGGIYSASL